MKSSIFLILSFMMIQASAANSCKITNGGAKICIGELVYTDSFKGLPFEFEAGTVIKFQENDSVQILNRSSGENQIVPINDLFLTSKTLTLGPKFKGRTLSAGEIIYFQLDTRYIARAAKVIAVRGSQIAVQVGCLDNYETQCYMTKQILKPDYLPRLYLTNGCLEGVGGKFCTSDNFVDVIYRSKLEVVGLNPDFIYGKFEGTISPYGTIERASVIKVESP